VLVRKIIVYFFIIFNLCESYGQTYDSIAHLRKQTKYFYDVKNSFNLPDYYQIDTIIRGIQQYNSSFNRERFGEWSGNIGRPSKSMIFEANHTSGFNFGVNTLSSIITNPFTIPYYQVRKPYTSIFYLSGPEKEDILKITHSQNVNKNWNFAFNFEIMDSWGSYQWQACDNRLFSINTNYFSPSGKYRILGVYYNNSIDIQENGGISSDSIFENNITQQTLSIPVNLQKARNLVKNYGFYVKQFYNFRLDNNDSTKNNSFNLGYISHTLHYSRESFLYTDNDGKSGFYKKIYFDSTFTHDTIFGQKLLNDFSWSNGISENPNNPSAFNMIIGAKHQFIEIIDTISKVSLNQISPYTTISVFAFGKFFLTISGEYVFGDYNGGDFLLKGEAKYSLLKREPDFAVLSGEISYNQRHADWFFKKYISNYFKWDNSFDRIHLLKIIAKLKIGNSRLEAHLHELNNWVYLDKNSLPAQQDEMIHLAIVKAKNEISFKKLQIESNIVFQSAYNCNIINIPKIALMQSWYLNLQLFKKYLYLQPGFTIFYNSAYYADNYMPALRMFHNQENKKIGNYLYADAFINLQIKRANIFLLYQHLNSGWNGYKYYLIPHYPQQTSALKLGITWRFYD